MKNLLLTYRKIKKNQSATTLGIAGLAVGLVCVLYIFFWVTDETSYDRFHKNADRIFVVHAYIDQGGGNKLNFPGCPPAVASALINENPEVENVCRFFPAYQEFLLVSGEHKNLEKTAFADYSLFDIFSFPFVYGDKGDSGNPNRIILTQRTAAKYFGSTNPVGKLIKFDFHTDLTIVGVIKDLPHNSTLTFDVVVPLESMGNHGYFLNPRPDLLSSWYNNAFMTFGLLVRPEGFAKVASTITRRIQNVIPESINYLRVYKFKNGYLYEQNHIRNVRIFSLIAFLVLLAATLNFINLSTARSLKQAKETGLRKSLGASRLSLARLVYSDTAMVCLLAFLTAIVIALLGLPLFNQAISKKIDYTILLSWRLMFALISVYMFTVTLAGSFSAIYLSKFTPSQTLSSNFQTTRKRGFFRNSLVVVIFVISNVLIGSTLVISKQARFMQRMDLGFEKDQLMYVSLKGKLKGQYSALKEEVGRSSDVFSSTVVAHLPNIIGNNSEGWDWDGKDPDFNPLVTNWGADEDLLKTIGGKMIEGNFFGKKQEGIVINETFAKIIGWDSFAGKSLNHSGKQVPVLGVIKDIRFNSLSEEIKPMVILAANWADNYMIIKVNTMHIGTVLNHIQSACKTIEPDIPVDYGFINDEYAKMLVDEINLTKLIGIFSVFVMVVLCLGLLGFVMFMSEQKIKEIGVRKCMGEQVASIVVRFIKPFLLTGLFAWIIAIPLTWFIIERWLQTYAYRIELNVWNFIIAGFISIAIAVLTVSWQSWKAATRNPVEALRCE